MTTAVVLLDATAFWRLRSPGLHPVRRAEIDDRVSRGLVAASTSLLLETRAGRDLPVVDPEELPWLWISERAERRATALQRQLRSAGQQLGVPPLDYLIAAIAEDHGVAVLHYDDDFERLAAHTDLAITPEALAPLGTLP